MIKDENIEQFAERMVQSCRFRESGERFYHQKENGKHSTIADCRYYATPDRVIRVFNVSSFDEYGHDIPREFDIDELETIANRQLKNERR